jgi:protocatechuate 3,4-dioxygenase beta subunit
MSKFFLCLLLPLFTFTIHFTVAAQAQPKKDVKRSAEVSGLVLLNGEPLSGVTIGFFPERASLPPEQYKKLQIITDEQGKYKMTGLAPGSYSIRVTPDEYILTGTALSGMNAKTLNLGEGETVEHFDLIFKRGGVITGRILDAGGQPVRLQHIELTKIGEDGKPQASPFNHGGAAFSGQHGEYRIVRLPMGRYLISSGLTRARRNGSQIEGRPLFPQTYYPSTTDPTQASIVEVHDGAETTGIDIVLAAEVKTHRIAGRVLRAESREPAAGIEVFYYPYRDEKSFIGPKSRVVKTDAEGEFQFQGLLPGKYLLLTPTNAEKGIYAEPVVCEVNESGAEGLTLELLPGAAINGAIVLEDVKDQTLLEKLSQARLSCYSRLRLHLNSTREGVKIIPNGSFRLAGLPPAKMYFSLTGDQSVSGFLIKRVEHNGVVVNDGLEVGAGEQLSNVRVIVGYGRQKLYGEVKVIGGELPPHVGIRVNLTRLNGYDNGMPLGINVDNRGEFRYENLSPGEYELRLVSVNYQPGDPHDKAIAKLIFNTRQKITIGPTGATDVTIVVDLSQK